MMAPDSDSYLLFSGTSHPRFAKEVADCLGTRLGEILFSPFPDGELYLQIQESVRGKEVFVVQSIAGSPNDRLMELLLIVDALKRASAKSIVAVLPYFGYARQDRKNLPRVPITAKLVADLLERAGVTRVLTMELHAGQIQGFFDIPVDNLYARPLLGDALLKLKLDRPVVMGPDLGAIKQARAYANHLGADLAVIDKRRLSSEEVEAFAIIGDIEGRDVILVDDMCSTGGTLVTAAKTCKMKGARRLYAAFSHGLLVGDTLKRLEQAGIEKIVMSNTIPREKSPSSIAEEVSVAPLFAEAIQRILLGRSIASIFENGS